MNENEYLYSEWNVFDIPIKSASERRMFTVKCRGAKILILIYTFVLYTCRNEQFSIS